MKGCQSCSIFTISRLAWIKRQQAKFESQERQAAREFVSGESHYYQGNRYLLNVIYREGAPEVIIRNNKTMDLYVRPGSDTARRERVLLGWYRQRLLVSPSPQRRSYPLIAKWEITIGVEVAEWGIKQMKTKWGTCNIEAQRIWLNLELIKKTLHCSE